MNYEIIATLGPSSADENMWEALIKAGATGFRLNTSHLTLDDLQIWLDRLDNYLSVKYSGFPVTLDMQGSKWRLGEMATRDLAAGQEIEFVFASSEVKPDCLPVPHRDFFAAASSSDERIFLDDAKICVQQLTCGADWMRVRVLQGGVIRSRKGITYLASNYRTDTLNEKDWQILQSTQHHQGVRYAISYLKDAQEMGHYRQLVGEDYYLIAKLERGQAIDEVVKIADYANELWVCRGDLGAEMGLRGMAQAVSRLSETVREICRPVILAGQVLEHMTQHSSPTRSEVCVLYEALRQGYRGFVLSDEAAVGIDPINVCQTAALFRD